jgi:hypothetical protein
MSLTSRLPTLSIDKEKMDPSTIDNCEKGGKIRATRWVVEKIDQNVAQPIFVKLNAVLLPQTK